MGVERVTSNLVLAVHVTSNLCNICSICFKRVKKGGGRARSQKGRRDEMIMRRWRLAKH